MRRRVPSCPELQQQLTELLEQRAAISEVLHAIASSPHELQPIVDTILDSATRLCRAGVGTLRFCEGKGFRLVAVKRGPDVGEQWSPPTLAERSSFLGLIAASRSLSHIPDLAAHEVYLRGKDPYMVAMVNLNLRTLLLVPMFKDEEMIAVISLGRYGVQPFTDNQINLITDFAAQATIALESTRRERQYRELQMELAHANRVATIGHLTASIVHELKQPLAAVMTSGDAMLRWLTRSPPEIEEAKRSVELVIKETNRASDILTRIHGLVKKDSRRTDTLNINDAINEVITLVHGEAVKDSVIIQTQLADHLPNVQGDRVQLQQVILNLIVNAIQAMSDVRENTRELQISTETLEPDGVRIGVRDTGLGLSPERLPRLFDPFYTTKPDGMGMGLSICRSIMEAHGGRLWATRCEPKGALFHFTIPAHLRVGDLDIARLDGTRAGGYAQHDRDQCQAGRQCEGPQAKSGFACCADGAAEQKPGDRPRGLLGAPTCVGDADPVSREQHVADIHGEDRDVGGHHRGRRRSGERDPHERVLNGHRRHAQHAAEDHRQSIRVDIWTGNGANREKGGEQKELQQQERPQGGDPAPSQAGGQHFCQDEHNNEHRHRQQLGNRRRAASKKPRRDIHEVAGNMGGEHTV